MSRSYYVGGEQGIVQMNGTIGSEKITGTERTGRTKKMKKSKVRKMKAVITFRSLCADHIPNKYYAGEEINFDSYKSKVVGAKIFSSTWTSNQGRIIGSEGSSATMILPDVLWPIHIDLGIVCKTKMAFDTLTLIRKGAYYKVKKNGN